MSNIKIKGKPYDIAILNSRHELDTPEPMKIYFQVRLWQENFVLLLSPLEDFATIQIGLLYSGASFFSKPWQTNPAQ